MSNFDSNGADMWPAFVNLTHPDLLSVCSLTGITTRFDMSPTNMTASNIMADTYTYGVGSIIYTSTSTTLGSRRHKTEMYGKHVLPGLKRASFPSLDLGDADVPFF